MRNWIDVILILALGFLLTSFLGNIARARNHGTISPGWARFIKIFWLVYIALAYLIANRYLGY